MEEVERHAVPPDGRSALDDDEGPAGDFGERGEGLGGGDGGGDADGVDDKSQANASVFIPKALATSKVRRGSLEIQRSASSLILHPGMILHP